MYKIKKLQYKKKVFYMLQGLPDVQGLMYEKKGPVKV